MSYLRQNMAAAREDRAARFELAARIMALPGNPETCPVGTGTKAFVLMSSRLRNNWSVGFHAFEEQYAKLAHAAARMDSLAFIRLLRKIRAEGQAKLAAPGQSSRAQIIAAANRGDRSTRRARSRPVFPASRDENGVKTSTAAEKTQFHPLAFLRVARLVGLTVKGNPATAWGRSLAAEIESEHRKQQHESPIT